MNYFAFAVLICSLLVIGDALPQGQRHKSRGRLNPRKSYGTMIVGGEPAEEGELPYQVALEYYDYQFCGGSIISVNGTVLVLTAAHCVDDEDTTGLEVVAGNLKLSENSLNGQRRQVTRILLHEEYDWYTNENDIALLVLGQTFNVTTHVAPIALPKQGQSTTGDVVVSGWGDLSSGGEAPDDLQKVTIPVVDDDTCQEAYDRELITPSMLCAGLLEEGGKDSCQGDSGGPLRAVNGSYIAGIVSWGYGCARPGYPGVNTEVSHFVNWIEGKVSRL